MLKLMKYEFRKSALSKLIILALATILEVIFVIGMVIGNQDYQAFGLGLMTMLAFAATFYVAFESISVLSKDLKTKNSYMLFLTPHTSYAIVGAKVLASGIQIILTGLAFLFIFIADGFALVAQYSSIAMIKDMIQAFFQKLTQSELRLDTIVLMFILMLLFWVFITTLSFFSITLSTTVLANNKLKGVLSFAIFIGIFTVFGKLSDFFSNSLMGNGVIFFSDNLQFIYASLFILVFIVATYLGTALLLEKKVSV